MKNKKIIVIPAASILVVLVAAIVLRFTLFQATPMNTEIVLELGEHLSKETSYYVSTNDRWTDDVTVDYSEVQEDVVGNYTVYSSVLFYHFTHNVQVVDTTAPTIEPKSIQYIENGKEYNPDYFVNSVYDRSGDVDVYIEQDGAKKETICFGENGDYQFQIVAEDFSGNSTSVDISVTVDTVPIILCADEPYYPVGQDIDWTLAALAKDDVDGYISEKIQVDDSLLDINIIGDYQVTYSVTDSYGLETSKSVTVHIVSKEDAGTHINVLSEQDMQILCDDGYFTYEPLKENDYEKTIELIKPTGVNIHDNIGKYSGSGFIYKITPQYVYFIGPTHLLDRDNVSTTIMFFNGKTIDVESTRKIYNTNYDIAMIRAETSSIPLDLLLELKEIYIDYDIYSKINVGDTLIAYATHWKGQENDYIKQSTLINTTSSMKLFGYEYFFEKTKNVITGMSGCSIVDEKGNLLGTTSCGKNDIEYPTRIDYIQDIYDSFSDEE